jgi:hypothetical protein
MYDPYYRTSLEEKLDDVTYDLDIARKTIDRLEARTVGLENTIDTFRDLLLDIRDWVDQRADADCDQDGFIANAEMKWAMAIDAAVAS